MTLVVAMLLVPMALVRPARWAAIHSSHVWSRCVLWAAGVRLTIEGAEGIASPGARYFIGNHQSALDIPVIVTALRGDVLFMAKDSLFRVPVFGWLLGKYGYIPIYRTNPRKTRAILDRMVDRLRTTPFALAVFPEGTRSRDGRLLPFRKGAVKIGQRAGLEVVPFSIDGTMAVGHPDRFRAVPGPVRLTFHRPIPAEEVKAISTEELHNRVREAVLQGLGQAPGRRATDDAAMIAPEGV